LQIEDEDEDDESFEVLRKAVKEYWVTMKEYHQAVRSSLSLSFSYFNFSFALGKCLA
jgi:uncharacterized protein (UPF0262 family)